MKIQPQSSPNAESLSFEIPALNSPCYYYFSDMELEVICRMESDEGKDILNDSDFTVVNNIGQSMFSDLKFFVADQQVTNFSNSLYPTFCYVQNLLNNDHAKQRNSMCAQGFTPECEKEWNKNFTGAGKTGFDTRKEYFGYPGETITSFHYFTSKEPATVFFSPVITEFNKCENPVISGVKARLELNRAPSYFYMMTRPDDKYKPGGGGSLNDDPTPDPPDPKSFTSQKPRLKILQMLLVIKVREMAPSLNLKIETMLSKRPVVYSEYFQETNV